MAKPLSDKESRDKLLEEQYLMKVNELKELGMTDDLIEKKLKEEFTDEEIKRLDELKRISSAELNKDEGIVNLVSVKEILENPIMPIDWMVDRWIPEGSHVLLAGKGGTGKSLLTEYLSVCLIAGKDFAGLKTKKKKRVLIIDMENNIELWNERFRFFQNGLNIKSGNIFKNLKIWFPPMLNFSDDEDWGKLEKIIEDFKPEVVIVDTLVRVSGVMEDPAVDVSDFYMTRIRPLFTKYKDLSLILIHHLKKGKKESEMIDLVRGSGDWVNQADVVIILKQNPTDESLIKMHHVKNRRRIRQKALTLQIEHDGYGRATQSFLKIKQVDTEMEKVLTLEAKYAKIIKECAGEDEFTPKEAKGWIKTREGHVPNNASMDKALKSLCYYGEIAQIGYGKYQKTKGLSKWTKEGD